MGLLEKFFDAAEGVVGGVEKVVGEKGKLWEVGEITDSESGESMFIIRDSTGRKLETSDKALAEMVCNVLNG